MASTSVRNKGEENTNLMAAERYPMDGFIKLILAILIMVAPFKVEDYLSFGIIALYLIFVSWVFKVNLRTIAISGNSFGIIVLFPYFFGLLVNALFYYFTHNALFVFQGFGPVFNRLFKLFVIWYVSILYFHTTPMQIFIGMLDKFLLPLKKLGLPTQDYLKVIMCIVVQLKETGAEMKKSVSEKMRSVVGEGKRRFKIDVGGISKVIVGLIVDSFEKLDKIQEYVDQVKPEDLFHYRFKLSGRDGGAIFSFLIFVGIIWIIERGIIL